MHMEAKLLRHERYSLSGALYRNCRKNSSFNFSAMRCCVVSDMNWVELPAYSCIRRAPCTSRSFLWTTQSDTSAHCPASSYRRHPLDRFPVDVRGEGPNRERPTTLRQVCRSAVGD